MNKFLFKLNMIKSNNEIVRLKKSNEIKDKKLQKVSDGCKSLIIEYEIKNQKALLELNEKVNKLENENSELRKQRDFYCSSLEKIPKFLLKLFVGKNKMLENGEENV